MRMTKDEILLVFIILLAFVAGAGAKHYRERHSQRNDGSQQSSGQVIAPSSAEAGVSNGAKQR